ncbi:unnamed protein product [Choristocarpus tenellus]
MPDPEGSWVADYFSVVGSRGDGDMDLLDPELHSPDMLGCIWEDAITDIVVIRPGKGEACPDGYELIERTPGNHKADLNHGRVRSWGLHRVVHLAIRRQHVSNRNDYIADIQVVYPNLESPPEGNGWELIRESVSGKKAKLNQESACPFRDGGEDVMLAVRRVVRDLLDCPPSVCSLCVLLRNKGEEPPPGYRVIEKDLNKGKFGDTVHLAYQLGGALSLCRLPYRSTILDRYPEEDSSIFPFPGDQLPMFVYPKGMLLERRSGHDTPKPSFFSFVFTNVDGRRTYTACLTFYEPLAPAAVRRLKRKVMDRPSDSSTSTSTAGGDKCGLETGGEVRVGMQTALGVSSILNSSQHSGARSRSGTGSWSGAGLGVASRPRRTGLGSVGQSSGLRTATSSWKRQPSFSAQGRTGLLPPVVGPLSETTSGAPYSPSQPQWPPPQRASSNSLSSGTLLSHMVEDQIVEESVKDIHLDHKKQSVEARGVAGAEEEAEKISKLHMANNIISATDPLEAEKPCLEVSGVVSNAGADEFTIGEAALNPKLENSELVSGAGNCVLSLVEDQDCVFAPKTICVISRFPIYGVLRRFLRHLYAISLSLTGVPLERYISYFVACIPMPFPGGRSFHVYLEPLEDEDPRRSRLKPITLLMPPDPWLPLMDIDFSAPFRCLSVHSVLTVFALMLQEAKIIFLSSRAELLTQVMEALRSLLFPMEWQSVYVPQLPYALAGCLECPGGFMIGMRLTKVELMDEAGGTAAIIRDLGLDGVANAVNLDTGEVRLCSGAIADVDPSRRHDLHHEKKVCHTYQIVFFQNHGWEKKRKRLLQFRRSRQLLIYSHTKGCSQGTGDGSSGSPTDLGEEERATPWLPHPLHADLESRLTRELIGKAGVRVGAEEDLDQYESAFEFAPSPDIRTDEFGDDYKLRHRMPFSSAHIKSVDSANVDVDRNITQNMRESCHNSDTAAASVGEFGATAVVRDCFICCMAELLGGIGNFVRRSEAKRSRHTLRTRPLDELFNMGDFLEGVDKQVRPFVQRLTSTQMFWVMVQKWLESSEKDDQLVFFEECVIAIKNRRAGAVVESLGESGTGPGNQDDYIHLVDEVRLKRPDLYRCDLNNAYSPARLGESSFSSLANPLHNQNSTIQQSQMWETKLDMNVDTPEYVKDQEIDWCRVPFKVVLPKNSVGVGHPGTDHMGRRMGLELMDSGAAPILIPGPTKQGLPKDLSCYRYDDRWPTPLRHELLDTPPEALPPVVLDIQLCSLTYKEQHHRRQQERGAPIGTSLMYGEFEPMVVLPYPIFKAVGMILRSNEAKSMTVSYASLRPCRDQSLVIFISHRWLQPCSQPPHPDRDGEKHGLICSGVEKLLQMLPQGVQAYLWVDFSCIDQDDAKKRKRGIRSMPSYIERCDALLIPYTATEGQTPGSLVNGFSGHKSENGKGKEFIGMEGVPTPDEDRYPSLAQYSSRAWCRAELYMGSNVPVPPNGFYYFDRVGMVYRGGDRPFFVYGPEQHEGGGPPAVLPRLDKAWFKKVNPVEAFLTQESDRREIFALLERVQCTTPASPKPGYQGEKRLWRRHGKGCMIFEDGRVYEGEWRDGKMCGNGVMEFSRGSRYEGEWKAGKKHGRGSMTYPDGARYDGMWFDGRRNGRGIYVYASGAVYNGEWENGKMSGEGYYTSANGSCYKGTFRHGKRCGEGRMQYGDGRSYTGEWEWGVRNGHGVYIQLDGAKFEGQFLKDRKHGLGTLEFNGVVVKQKWEYGILLTEP